MLFPSDQFVSSVMKGTLDAPNSVLPDLMLYAAPGTYKPTLDVAKAKYFAGETVNKCANYAMRMLGAYGYSTEYPVARFYRDAPTYTMVEGSSNICKWIIALDQLGIRKANR